MKNKTHKTGSDNISWIDCDFLDGASLSFDNAKIHFKYSDLAAESKDYGFAISHIVLGMEELIKSLLLVCLNGNGHFINDEQKVQIFRKHEIKHFNINQFLEALTEYSIGDYTENTIEYVELNDSTKFKRPAYFLSKTLELGDISDSEIDELTTILKDVNSYKNKGFYVDVRSSGDFKSPAEIKETEYNRFKKAADTLKRFVVPIFETPLSDQMILDFLDESNWRYF